MFNHIFSFARRFSSDGLVPISVLGLIVSIADFGDKLIRSFVEILFAGFAA